MRVAALYDIHGNLPALEAVLSEVEQYNVDQIVVGGDIVLGPMSNECLDFLLSVPIPISCIKGNCEVAVLNQLNNELPATFPDVVKRQIAWTASTLTTTHQSMSPCRACALSLSCDSRVPHGIGLTVCENRQWGQG